MQQLGGVNDLDAVLLEPGHDLAEDADGIGPEMADPHGAPAPFRKSDEPPDLLAHVVGTVLMVEEEVDGQLVLNQPAGHVEAGESFIQAVIRETLEETAYPFQPEAVTGIYHWQHPGNGITFVRHAFTGNVGQLDKTRELDDGIVRAVWLTPEKLRAQPERLRSPLVMKTIEDYLQGKRFDLDLYTEVR